MSCRNENLLFLENLAGKDQLDADPMITFGAAVPKVSLFCMLGFHRIVEESPDGFF